MDSFIKVLIGIGIFILVMRSFATIYNNNSTVIENSQMNTTHTDCVKAKLHSLAIGITPEQGTYHWKNCGLRTNEVFCFEKMKKICEVNW